MSWQFWRPKHTVGSVAELLASGLRDGSVVLDEPFDDETDSDALVLQLDVPTGASDAMILELVKQCATRADQNDRAEGGKGLRIGRVIITYPKVKVALQSREKDNRAGAS